MTPLFLLKHLILRKISYIILTIETESCPSWSKEHDWKSCKPPKRLRGFESLALRQKETNTFYRVCLFSIVSCDNYIVNMCFPENDVENCGYHFEIATERYIYREDNNNVRKNL